MNTRNVAKLDANECPWPPELDVAALARVMLNRYPDAAEHERLKAFIAELNGVRRGAVSLGNGSDDLLFRFLHVHQGAHVVVLHPSYPFHPEFALRNNCRVTTLALDRRYQLPASFAADVASIAPDVAFICYPNNPTGTLYDAGVLARAVTEHADTLWVFDEAYYEFSRRSMLPLLEAGHDNVVILRTLSKAWGLAGVRFGYAFSTPAIAASLDASLLPYHISSLTLRAAWTRVRSHPPLEIVQRLVAARHRLSSALAQLPGVEVAPSEANFLWVTCARPGLADHLERCGILVKAPRLGGPGVRISVGTEEENESVMRCVGEHARGS